MLLEVLLRIVEMRVNGGMKGFSEVVFPKEDNRHFIEGKTYYYVQHECHLLGPYRHIKSAKRKMYAIGEVYIRVEMAKMAATRSVKQKVLEFCTNSGYSNEFPLTA